ncbi:poly [ADP-ribose] polymerase-like isoform X2 [Microplitis mediator]|uniref:poly [ADP-ribose] polymerase-like isoform X2 n=1 Tax=Microplitis mediator TaxID=375433 RepID=UPI00255422D0|nr:poly [ADP-ribose] polymerase-like isoform X2 [Microplitis mediator]
MAEKETYRVEYAKSGNAVCRLCQSKIKKNDLRFVKNIERPFTNKVTLSWFHPECFFVDTKLNNIGEISNSENIRWRDQEYLKKKIGDDMPGYSDKLWSHHRDLMLECLPPIEYAAEEETSSVDELEETMKRQNEELFEVMDALQDVCKKDLVRLLSTNGQLVPKSRQQIIEAVADQVVFGALPICFKCLGFNYVFESGVGYRCMGDLTSWTKCKNVCVYPVRTKFIISNDLMQRYPFLCSNEFRTQDRMIRIPAPSDPVTEEAEALDAEGSAEANSQVKPLKGLLFAIGGKTFNNKDILKRNIVKLGGKIVTKVTREVAAVVTSVWTLAKPNQMIRDAQRLRVNVVGEGFVDEAKHCTDTPFQLIVARSICPWGSDPSVRCAGYLASLNGKGKVTLKIKGGGAVDPKSGLDHVAHVYQQHNDKFTVTLGLTDIEDNKNDYYKMQILEHDNGNKFWLFTSWGRIGTTIGGSSLRSMSLDSCIDFFKKNYLKKTGNDWGNHSALFVKCPGMFYLINTEDTDDTKINRIQSTVQSQLKPPVKDLVALIFNVEYMKMVMLEYELDIDRMPLGALSTNQIQQAYQVLSDVMSIIRNNNDQALLVDASNRFYTLVPHSFGLNSPPILDSIEAVQKKCEMLNSLMEMAISYRILYDNVNINLHPIDDRYFKLNTYIDVLDPNSFEYQIIQRYAMNTHSHCHASFELKIENIFVISRRGEDERYRQFSGFYNKRLLWHGSRTTNFAGILAHGLRVAPPEVPSSGYMFGKGIYFADVVSKSANYCSTTYSNPTGLLLLCEVALGNMYERVQADYITELPYGFHSTFGRGKNIPDPKDYFITRDNVLVPYGKPVRADLYNVLALAHNEYVVYNPAQIKTKYLLRVNFVHK